MPRSYSCVWNATNTQSTTVPIMGIIGAVTVRPALYDILQGSSAVPADNAFDFLLRRYSAGALSGGTAGTPAPLDSLDAAAASSYMYGASIGAPTLGVSLLELPLNQRATMRWVAVPGREVLLAAIATAGVCWLPDVVNSSAVNVGGTWWFTE